MKATYTQHQLAHMLENCRLKSSWRQAEKLHCAGIEPRKRYELGNNIFVEWCPRHGAMDKIFWWGNRQVKKETALRRAGLE